MKEFAPVKKSKLCVVDLFIFFGSKTRIVFPLISREYRLIDAGEIKAE